MLTLSGNLRRLRRDKSAAVAMIVALSLPMLVGAAALTVDIANFRYVQGRLQSAADAGALAAISKIYKASDAKAAGADYAGRNVPQGFGDVTQSGDVEIGIWDPVARSFTPYRPDWRMISGSSRCSSSMVGMTMP